MLTGNTYNAYPKLILLTVYPRAYGEHSNFIYLFCNEFLRGKNSTTFFAYKLVKLLRLFFPNYGLYYRSHFIHFPESHLFYGEYRGQCDVDAEEIAATQILTAPYAAFYVI
ncbi:conserved protein of unknown function [Xenorhabdus poinarii G6]|uniref:Uncharacterized protein n=1 Tax=Xenorhabdus poinarii G6 TaxID=1354304 RepID=A0A068QZH1_9GAMM|nr:conserved protein of unknown function [Xenorhabdus poinarii G6]